MFTPGEIAARAQLYANSRTIGLLGLLRAGKDGTVWRTTRTTALKIHATDTSYRIERNAYIRLGQLKVSQVAHFSVPMMDEFDDELLAIEMSIVSPPFLLDFASAIFDHPPDFSKTKATPSRILSARVLMTGPTRCWIYISN